MTGQEDCVISIAVSSRNGMLELGTTFKKQNGGLLEGSFEKIIPNIYKLQFRLISKTIY